MKKFINKSYYPGGSKALQKFIRENLKYPKKALKNNTEGEVLIQFKVNHKGNVYEAKVIKGISQECNQEAIRLINKLKYLETTNRKIRASTSKKIKIKFSLPNKNDNLTINYSIIK